MMKFKKLSLLILLLLSLSVVWAQGRRPAVDPVQEIAADQELGTLTTFVGHNFSALAPQDLRSPELIQSERRYLQDQKDLSLIYLLALLAIIPAGIWYAVKSQLRFEKKQTGGESTGGKVFTLPTAQQRSEKDEEQNKKAA